MHYIKGCPCLFKVAWIADQALKNIYVIQKCASCGYTKEQCDYVFEELKNMKMVDTKPEAAYISDLYQTYGELSFHCEEVDTNFHFEPECQKVDFCKICEFSKDFCNCQLNAELQVLRYMYHNPTVSMIRRNVFHMQVCIILEQMGHIKGYLLPLGEQLYKAFKDARKRTSASFLYDKEKLLDHILNENRGILPEQYVLAARKILRNLLDAILIENEVCSAKRYEDCLKKLRAAPAYQGRERQQFFEDICIYDEISYLFFEAVAVEFGQKDDKQICPEGAHSAHKKKILVPTYSDRPALSLEELMSQASMSAGFLGHEAKEEEKLSWLRQILEWQRDMSDNREFLNLLKGDLDLFAEDVYCFTPNGDVKNLPNGSTPVDFAYAIHTAVGNKMVGARVNGKLVNIDYKIQNGDRIEILTSQNSKGPSRDWLSIVKSTQAKNKINQWFKKEFKEENIVRGKEMLATYCKAKGFVLSDLMKLKYMQIVQEKYGFKDWDSILAALGHGGLKEGQIVNRLAEEYSKDHRKELTDESVLEKVAEAAKNKVHITRSKSGIVVKGIDDMAVRFSRCCNPVPGDEIVGFITRGRGMSIHRTDCVNIIHLSEAERARLIPAEWEKPEEGTDTGSYLAEIKMYANDRQGLLMDMSKVFTEMNIDVKSMNVRTSKQGTATIEAGFIVRGREELGKVIGKLRQIVGVLDIERAVG